MDTKNIIKQVANTLKPNIQWWPYYFYHYTDINNAVGILSDEQIFGRSELKQSGKMKSENASSSVIEVTSQSAQEYARLYFRPLTPTQFHNEGYKPICFAKSINASCAVPVFFVLDADEILNLEGVKIVEGGIAGNRGDNGYKTAEDYQNLSFDSIYHDGGVGFDETIKFYRQSEIIRKPSFPLKNLLRAIICRSEAEQETLIYLLKKQKLYERYKNYIHLAANRKYFNNRGIFIENVKANSEQVFIKYNDTIRDSDYKNEEVEIDVSINGKKLRNKLVQDIFSLELSQNFYAKGIRARSDFSNIDSVYLQILFDKHLMYENEISMEESNIY